MSPIRTIEGRDNKIERTKEMKKEKTYYWLTALFFTLFFALFMLSYQQRDFTAERSIFIEVKSNKPVCQVSLIADGVVVGVASMENGNCDINIYKE